MQQSKLSDLNPNAAIASKVSRRSKAVEIDRRQKQPQVRELHRNTTIPPWLQSILKVQQGAKIVFVAVVGSIPFVYGYTVYTQDLWKTQYGQLNRLHVRGQQQLVMTENLKQQAAQAGDKPNSGLVAPTPDRMVFVTEEPPRPLKQRPQTPASNKNLDSTPQGY